MKIKPILFSTEMVQAILKGRKTQTRRIVKIQPKENDDVDAELKPDWDEKTDYPLTLFYNYKGTRKASIYYGAQSPLCQPGDILWVRESYHLAEENEYRVKYIYKADIYPNLLKSHKFKPSIHMPKEAARIFLKVINVRCEKLGDISEIDCVNEGIEYEGDINDTPSFRNYLVPGTLKQFSFGIPSNSFFSLWEVINGKDSLKKNPFVWVYEYEQTEKPENFLTTN